MPDASDQLSTFREWSAFLDPSVLDPSKTAQWIADQQAPIAWSRLNLDPILQRFLGMAWQGLLAELRTGIQVKPTNVGRDIQVTRWMVFVVSHLPFRIEAGFDHPGRSTAWFTFDLFRPLSGGFWIERVVHTQVVLKQLLDEVISEHGFEAGPVAHLFSPVRNQIHGLLWNQICRTAAARLLQHLDAIALDGYLLACLQVPPDLLLIALTHQKPPQSGRRIQNYDLGRAIPPTMLKSAG